MPMESATATITVSVFDADFTQATGNVAWLFGDFSAGYVVRKVRGMELVRLDERYADYLQVGFFGFDRQDSTKDDTQAYKALVMG